MNTATVIKHNFGAPEKKEAYSPLKKLHCKEIPSTTDVRRWGRLQIDEGLLRWMTRNLDSKLLPRCLNLMMASMAQIPGGTLPDDDNVLAQCAGYSAGSVKTWLGVKDSRDGLDLV